MWSFLKHILKDQGGYIGKAKKAAWANEQKLMDKQVAAMREQIASQERMMKEQTDAMMKASKDSAIGGIIGAALGANTTTREIKQLLPHESGAATLMSYELAEKWNTTLEMKTQGYSQVAIDYALSGNNYRSLYKDSKYNAAMFMENQRSDLEASLQMFGVQSAGNPAGISMSKEQYIQMHSVKDAKSMLEVDPVKAKERQEQFNEWERQMRASGKGLLVDIYKNPQLAGSNIMAMHPQKLIPDELMPALQAVAGDGGGTVDWGQVLKDMNAGRDTPYAKDIQWAIDNGVIDEYGQINGGSILQHVPPELQKPEDYDPHRQLTPEEIAILTDNYNKLSEITVDPKLVKEKVIGDGVTAKTKLNADGTVAGQFMSGYMTDSTGARINVTVQGNNMQDWMRKQTDAMSGLGPLFPQFFAMQNSATSGDRTGTLTNQLATANQGSKNDYRSTDAVGAQQQKAQDNKATYKAPTMPSAFGSGAQPTAAPKNDGPNGAPTGYTGAPLAAGEGYGSPKV